MSSEPTPVDRGRNPQTGAHRIFLALSDELAEANTRLGHVATATNALDRHLKRVRQLLAESPIVMTVETIRAIEAEIHHCCLLVVGAGTSATGVSAKVTASRHLVHNGVQMGRLRPQPSLN